MAGSNFPNGFAQGVTIKGIPLTVSNPGKVFWVGGTALAPGAVGSSNGNDGTYRRPFNTIDYAVGKCTANRGDIIMVMPGHSEDVATATSVVFDVAGVAVIGLGTGSDRPDFNFSATAGSVEIDAANVTIYNCTFTADVSAVVVGVNVDANGVTLDNVEFNFNATGDDFILMIDVDTVDSFTLSNSKLLGEDNTAGGAIAVRLDTDTQTVIRNNFIIGEFLTGAITGIGGAGAQTLIADNLIYNADTAGGECIQVTVAHTGMLVNNMCGTLFPTDNEAAIDPGSLLCFENYVANAVDESAGLVPETLST